MRYDCSTNSIFLVVKGILSDSYVWIMIEKYGRKRKVDFINLGVSCFFTRTSKMEESPLTFSLSKSILLFLLNQRSPCFLLKRLYPIKGLGIIQLIWIFILDLPFENPFGCNNFTIVNLLLPLSCTQRRMIGSRMPCNIVIYWGDLPPPSSHIMLYMDGPL